MLLLVQDFLDYTQIKSGQFRKNITEFDVRQTVEKVMSIQMSKAKDKGIRLIAEFKSAEGLRMRSWTIQSDE